MELKLKANAKINLLLDVKGLKKNGYHNLFTVMQSVSLGDIITIKKCKGEKITITCNEPGVPLDSKNIVYKCAKAFYEYSGINKNKGIHIDIEKHTPFCAGLGGGSADGAATLVALNKIFETFYTDKVLCRIGASVGADIPFCIVGGTCLALSTGEVVAPLPDIDSYNIVIVKPQDGVSTKEAYKAIDSMDYIKHPKNNLMLEYLTMGESDKAIKHCSNVFEQAIEVRGRVDIKDICNKNKAMATCMSGSGSAVFSIFKSKEAAENTVKELKKQFTNVYLCEPAPLGVEILK